MDSHQVDDPQQGPQRLDPQREDPVQQIEVLDADEVPSKYRENRVASGRVRQPDNCGDNNTNSRSISKDRYKLSSCGEPEGVDDHGAYGPAPAKDSPGIVKSFTNWVSGPRRPSAKEKAKQQMHKKQNNTDHRPEDVHRGGGASEQIRISQDDIIQLKRNFQHTLEVKERQWEARESEFRQHISRISHHLEENTRILKTKLHESETEKLSLQEQHNAFIRKQQEASFRLQESARWLPMDEGKVMSELEGLKADMRKWARETSIKDISLLELRGEAEKIALMQDLANVVLFENGQLPEGLSTAPRSPMLLLNALLAHSVYTSFFQSPFFFLDKKDEISSLNTRPVGVLEDIYGRAQNANQQDAHIWRSQTLRLLMPPMRDNISDAEKHLRSMTEESIARVADRQASEFLASSACYLIKSESKAGFTNRLKKMFSDAANLSFKLWTRRTQIRCFTLRDLKTLSFDAASPDFEPDSLVRWDDYEDHLKDRPVTVMVHPLLKAYGNDEATDYDQGRVWAKGAVWLDSKV